MVNQSVSEAEPLHPVAASLPPTDCVSTFDAKSAERGTIARAVHELRAPLSAAIGYCDSLLSGGSNLNSDQIEALERMEYCLSRLNRLSTALLHHATGRGSMRSKRLAGDIVQTIKRGAVQLVPFAEEKGIRIRLALEPPSRPVRFDDGQIEQVVVNILENACKFTPRGGLIEVRGFAVSGPKASDSVPDYCVEIQDSGPGVEPRHRSAIFAEGFTAGVDDARCGTGLGLAICKALITAHKGIISASSSGSGLTISFTLPGGDRDRSRRRPSSPRKTGAAGAASV